MATINTDDFLPNSHKYREEKDQEKKIKRVANVNARVKERSLGSKFKDTFLGEEIGDAKHYIVFDVVVPAIKEMIVDTVENAVEMIFGVGGGRRTRSNRDKGNESVSYTAYYKSKDRKTTSRDTSSRDGYDYKEIIVDTRGEAEEILDILGDALEQYNQVSVADLYDAIGKTPDFTDYKYGWTNLRGSYAKRVRDGYLIVLPKAVPIE